jgi:hypothetical protein
VVRAVGGGAWSALRRRELREKVRAGELESLEFEASVFSTRPNRNHVRFEAGDLPALAASYVGVPFLRNHDLQDIGARDGTVVASRLVGDEFHQTIRLTTERGMRDFVEGVIDRFSIGWYFEDVKCSVCGESWLGCPHHPGKVYDGARCELVFVRPTGKEVSAVNAPAVQGTRILEQLSTLKESQMDDEEKVIYPVKVERLQVAGEPSPEVGQASAQVSPADEVKALRAELDQERIERMIGASGLTSEGKAVVRLASKGHSPEFTSQLIEAQRKADGARLDEQLVRGIRPSHGGPGAQVTGMMTPLDRVQSAWTWLMGSREEPVPVPSMRSVRDLYLAVTGDFEWYGRFNPEWSQLSAASTTTLAGMTVNALNKVVRMHYDNLVTYRWYENIVDVAPHDSTTHNVQLIMVDGLANLPAVAEGAAYTEAVVGDSKEVLTFSKYGHYVGITLEAIRRGDIQRLQAIPRALVQGAVRTRSAAIASLFTINTSTGPTMADDSTALFHSNHGNTATTALGSDGVAWAAARQRIWEQTVPGTGKPLGLWPTFVLVPIELYDLALTLFGYGTGDVGKPSSAGTAQTVNSYGESRPGDPRPIPIPVPDWTDATNWGYIVDPRLHPVISMAYANAPQGGAHPMPEIFEVTSESHGLMFSNDTMPVKVRDWWGYGVATWVGVGNNIVAG